MSTNFNKIIRGIRLIASAMFIISIMITFFNVVGRYLFNSPIFWAEEITILLVIWAVFLVAFELTLRDEHLKMGLLEAVLPERFNRSLKVITFLIGGVISAYLAYQSIDVINLMIKFSQVTTVAKVPKWLIFSSVTVGFSLITVALFIRVVDLIFYNSKNGNNKSGNKAC